MSPVVVGSVAAIAGVFVSPWAAPAVLGILGFRATGPTAGEWNVAKSRNTPQSTFYLQTGSFATRAQSSLAKGALVGGSLFAVAQSVGAGGQLPVAGYMISGAVTGGIAATVTYVAGKAERNDMGPDEKTKVDGL